MSVSNPQKTVTPTEIDCGGRATVTLSFDAQAELSSVPADIVLVMDRSMSMDAWRLDETKKAAWKLVNAVEKASGSVLPGRISNGSRLGLVTYSSTARWVVGLTNKSSYVSDAISKLTAEGYTNHSEAFEAAERMLKTRGKEGNRQVVVMFTDGHTHNRGVDPLPITDRMKAAGMEIFSVGLVKIPTELFQWASDPASIHVAYTGNAQGLSRIFEEITVGVVRAGAQQVVIEERVNPAFRLETLCTASVGTAERTGPQSLTWTIPELGTGGTKTRAVLSFTVRHLGKVGGLLPVNQSLVYRDLEGSRLVFPSPEIQVNCQPPDPGPDPGPDPDPDPPPGPEPEPLPEASTFVVRGCCDGARVKVEADVQA